MTVLLWTGVAVLGGLGAVARVVVTRAFAAAWAGTLAINVSGALAIGLLVGAGLDGDGLLLLGGGLLGALTTFSAWMAEARGRRGPALLVAALVFGLGAAALGRMVGAAL